YIGAEALDPKGTDQVVTSTAVGLRLLPIASAHSSQLYLSGSLSVLALGGLAVSYAAITKLVTGRGWVIATIAALLGGLGAFAGAMLNVLGGISLAVAASAHMTQAAAAQFLVTSFGSWPAQAAAYIYFASEYIAPVVMGFALWRSRRVPRWLAVLFTVGLEVAESMGAIGPQVVLFMLPFAVAMILLAVKIWQSSERSDQANYGRHIPSLRPLPGRRVINAIAGSGRTPAWFRRGRGRTPRVRPGRRTACSTAR
ncbi:MAG: hypothetical protein ABSB59_41110, partial [Streptosporangiaceae bacterium]